MIARTVSVVGGPFCGYALLYDEAGICIGLRLVDVNKQTGEDVLRDPQPRERLRARSAEVGTELTLCALDGTNEAMYRHVALDTGLSQWQHVSNVSL